MDDLSAEHGSVRAGIRRDDVEAWKAAEYKRGLEAGRKRRTMTDLLTYAALLLSGFAILLTLFVRIDSEVTRDMRELCQQHYAATAMSRGNVEFCVRADGTMIMPPDSLRRQ